MRIPTWASCTDIRKKKRLMPESLGVLEETTVWGSLALSMMGTMARVLELRHDPVMASTLFWSANFWAPAAACLGSPASSWVTNSISWPFTPPALLISWKANSRPFLWLTP